MKKFAYSILLMVGLLLLSPNLFSQVEISISATIAPPPLPVYEQPICPEEGYLWTPGYWAYDDGDYYWVPGVWVSPPQPGYLWTPSYWDFIGGVYGWHRGYWGEHVGFYGGVNYGYGYWGHGFGGGRWEGDRFSYNTAVMNVNTTIIHNTYIDRTVIINRKSHTSYNGGEGGTRARPTDRERTAMKEHHFSPTTAQTSHQQTAGHDKGQFAKENHGRPAIATMNKVDGNRFGQKEHAASADRPAHVQPKQEAHQQGGNNGMHQQNHGEASTPASHNGGKPVEGSHSTGPFPRPREPIRQAPQVRQPQMQLHPQQDRQVQSQQPQRQQQPRPQQSQPRPMQQQARPQQQPQRAPQNQQPHKDNEHRPH